MNGTIDEEPSFLGRLYERISQVRPRSVLSNYLSGQTPDSKETQPGLIEQ